MSFQKRQNVPSYNFSTDFQQVFNMKLHKISEIVHQITIFPQCEIIDDSEKLTIDIFAHKCIKVIMLK